MNAPVEVGRYLLYDALASGGMARVHIGRIVGPAGFSRVVAIKRLHPHLAGDPKVASMFLDEARLTSRIQHPNVIGTLDVVAQDNEIFLVMDLVRGESLSQLMSRAVDATPPIAPRVGVVVAILVDVLTGLHAAHEAEDEARRPLSIVHRDVSPQNVLVGVDGISRVVDFGIAKAASRREQTEGGEIKGKLAYMAPEQLRAGSLDRRTDVYGASVVLWEALAGRRLFAADEPGAVVTSVLMNDVLPPSRWNAEVNGSLDAVALRGLARSPSERFQTALAMAEALAEAWPPASPREVSAWVRQAGGADLDAKLRRISELEQNRPAGEAVAIAGILSGTERRRIIEAPTGAMPLQRADAPDEGARAPVRTVPARRRRWVALVVSIAAASALLASMARSPTSPSPSLSGTPASSPMAAAEIATAPPPASSSAGLVMPASSSAGLVMPAVTSSAPRPVGAQAPSVRRPPGHRAPRATPSAPANCDPPYTIDESGIKRFKRWCVGPQ